MKTLKKQFLLALFLPLAFISCEKFDLKESGDLVPLTVDEDPSLPSISVNNTMLHSETFGNPDSTMLVVLHGGPGHDYQNMLKLSTFAEEGYFVVFYDQRGSGLSKRHDADVFTTQIFIDDLDAVIEHYRSSPTQKIVLVGQSWGAMLAAGYVNDFPNRIAGLALTEPGGFTWKDTKDYISRSLPIELLSEGLNDLTYQDQFLTGDDHATLDYKAMTGETANTNVGNAGHTPFLRKGAVCASALVKNGKDTNFDFTTNLSAYKTEILFGYSELNPAYGRTHAELVSSAFPNVKLVEIMGSGHSIPYFGWEGYYSAISSYLNSLK